MGACALIATSPSKADDLSYAQRAAVGAVAHEFDAGGPYLRGELVARSDEGGMATGVAVWHGQGSDWGAGFPFAVHAALLTSPARLALGGGLDFVQIDRLAGRTGVGLFSPLALVELDVPLGGVRVGAEARLEYRWKSFGSAYEQAQLSLGITLALPLEDE